MIYFVFLYTIFCIKTVVYFFITMNILKTTQSQEQDNGSSWSDSVLRFLYIFNFNLFFIPVCDTLCAIFKCFGPNMLDPQNSHKICEINTDAKRAYFAISIVIFLIKIFINISHEVCDTDKKIKYAKSWSK